MTTNNTNTITTTDTDNSINNTNTTNINTKDSTNQNNDDTVNIIRSGLQQYHQSASATSSITYAPITASPPATSFSLLGSGNGGSKLGTITVWLTSECNLRCKYCFVYKLNEKQSPGKMSIETADQLIRFAEQYLQPEGTFWFFGAEPLCNIETMKYIVEKSVKEGYKWKYGATTNATLLTKDTVQWMKKHNFTVLCSIDGPKTAHNKNRVYPNGEGSWDDAWQGLSNVREILGVEPQVRWTVTPSTLRGLAENIRVFVEEYHITNMPIDFVHEVEWTQEDYDTLRVELEIFRDYYTKWMMQGLSVFSMWVRDTNAAVNSEVGRQWRSRCGLGTGSVGVDYDGTIYPCHRFIDSHEIKIGNIYSGFNSMQREWMEKWLKMPPYCEIPKKCLHCNYKRACSGGCVAMNYDILGTVHAIPDTFCTIKQLITKVFGELCKSLQNSGNETFNKLYNNRQLKQKRTNQNSNNIINQNRPNQNSSTPYQTTKDLCSCQTKPN